MKKIIFICSLVSSIALTGCMTTPALPQEQRPAQWGTLLDKQHNFYQISKTVYRSEQPNVLFIPQLKKYNIKNIVNLRNSTEDFAILDKNQFNLIHYPIDTWQINRNDLLKVMLAIGDAEKRGEKILIHCYHGSDRTGASIAMYRIIFQNWTIEQATQEMKHGGYGFHRIWKNIEHLFTEENVQWIRQQMKQTT